KFPCNIYLDNLPITTAQDVSIQCELMLDERTYAFDIPDIRPRRQLVRRFYYLLMLEIALAVPCSEIMFILTFPRNQLFLRVVTIVVLLILYTFLYLWPNWRRYPPYNYCVFLLTSLTTAISMSIYLIQFGQTRWLHAYPLIVITELLAVALYTKQDRLKCSHGVGVIIIFLVFGLFLVLAYFLGMLFKLLGLFGCTLEAWYIIYDTHLMLCGHHGYDVKPQEYVFAAVNIHADVPKFLWILIRHLVLGPFVMFIELIRNCRTSGIC
ncbi:protein lifeguard 1, partial [Drosophila novamexicana]|uniref:protein lifeguard 1 n=1 Tax=Drosophila novamexicana TaxID=47314 RepID=UPI0011E59602